MDDYYSSREQVIDFNTKLSKKIAKLRLRGISSWKPKHYKLMYAIQNGTLIPPDRVLKSIMDPAAYPGTAESGTKVLAYRRGIFNPFVLSKMTTNNRADSGYREDPFLMFEGGMYDGDLTDLDGRVPGENNFVTFPLSA